VENGVTLGGLPLIGTSEFTSEILEKSDLWRDITIRRCAKQREVHGYHEQGPLVQSLRVRGIAAIGDRTQCHGICHDGESGAALQSRTGGGGAGGWAGARCSRDPFHLTD
jgi:hypothetical protein